MTMKLVSMVGEKMESYSKADLLVALERIEKRYPAVFVHFFMAEVDPEWYKQYMDGLGKDNDSRQSDPGLDQEQKTNSG